MKLRWESSISNNKGFKIIMFDLLAFQNHLDKINSQKYMVIRNKHNTI